MNATSSSETKKNGLTRRSFIQRGGMAGILAASVGPFLRLGPEARAGNLATTPFPYTPFTRALPIPGRMAPVDFGAMAPGSANCCVGSPNVWHGIAAEYDPSHPFNKASWANEITDPATGKAFKEKHHFLDIVPTTHEYIPGIKTPVYGYNAVVPSATMRARHGESMVVRVRNTLKDVECSLHLHGGHSPAHSDGHPCFYILPSQCRDYYYPHIVPKHGDKQDIAECPSTMWFHDHGNDTTAYNVAHGLAGFSLFTDRLEESWIANGQLPDVDLRSPSTKVGTKLTLGNLTLDAKGATQQGQYDIPMAFTDQALNPDGTLFWDAFDHDGRIGDLFTVNGVTQPFLNVEPRKYRFRLLGASLARVYMLRLSSGDTMTQIGYDSWLLPKPVTVSEIKLGPAKRADVIIDFSKLAGKTIYLQNIMQQSTGRKPDGVDAKKPTNIVQFKVGTKANFAQYPEFTLPTTLRPHATLLEKDATVTRYFDFNRSNGAWQINQQFYSAVRCDAAIKKGALEKWVLRNGSGGWWHPIHIHVEAHQVLRINGVTPPEIQKYKSDNSMLEDNTTVELLMKFRTFDGPFVFHCHNNQHEDMRMMKQFEICNPNPDGTVSPCLNGQWFSVPEKACGVPTSFIQANPGLFS